MITSPGAQPLTLGNVWIGETRHDPVVLAAALEAEGKRHPASCPRSIAVVYACTCYPNAGTVMAPARR